MLSARGSRLGSLGNGHGLRLGCRIADRDFRALSPRDAGLVPVGAEYDRLVEAEVIGRGRDETLDNTFIILDSVPAQIGKAFAGDENLLACRERCLYFFPAILFPARLGLDGAFSGRLRPLLDWLNSSTTFAPTLSRLAFIHLRCWLLLNGTLGLLWSTVCSITGRLLCADPLFIGCASFGWLLYQCPVEVHAQPFAFRNRRNLERCIRVCRNIGFVVQEKRDRQ